MNATRTELLNQARQYPHLDATILSIAEKATSKEQLQQLVRKLKSEELRERILNLAVLVLIVGLLIGTAYTLFTGTSNFWIIGAALSTYGVFILLQRHFESGSRRAENAKALKSTSLVVDEADFQRLIEYVQFGAPGVDTWRNLALSERGGLALFDLEVMQGLTLLSVLSESEADPDDDQTAHIISLASIFESCSDLLAQYCRRLSKEAIERLDEVSKRHYLLLSSARRWPGADQGILSIVQDAESAEIVAAKRSVIEEKRRQASRTVSRWCACGLALILAVPLLQTVVLTQMEKLNYGAPIQSKAIVVIFTVLAIVIFCFERLMANQNEIRTFDKQLAQFCAVGETQTEHIIRECRQHGNEDAISWIDLSTKKRGQLHQFDLEVIRCMRQLQKSRRAPAVVEAT